MAVNTQKSWNDIHEEEEEDIILSSFVSKKLAINDDAGTEDEHRNITEQESENSITDSDNFSSDYSLEEEVAIEPYDFDNLPTYACKYCGIHEEASVARCLCCNNWFCNGKGNSNAGSHIVQHLVRAKHREIILHPQSVIEDSPLECYNCGNKNIFILGCIPAKSEGLVVLLCRQPCATSAGSAKNADWDLESWEPLIKDRALVSWLVPKPSDVEQMKSRPVSAEQILRLENMWKENPNAKFEDLNVVKGEAEDVAKVQLQYESAFHYQSVMSPLVQLEADYDKACKDAQKQNSISIRWDTAMNMKKIAMFYLPVSLDADFRVNAGDEVLIEHAMGKFSAKGNVKRSPNSISEEVIVEFDFIKKIPSELSGYSVSFLWNAAPYTRMQRALSKMAMDDRCFEPSILNQLLGHSVDCPDMSIPLPKDISAPGLPSLNHSQSKAVQLTLVKPLSLIQGPPGTGKTVTCATIVYHLANRNSGPILVCAPSNVAVDHLTEKIHMTGLRVVRVSAKSREDIESATSFLSLHSQVQNNYARPKLLKLIQLKSENGELSAPDEKLYTKMIKETERKVLAGAQVICCTTVGAGDFRLQNMKFSAVLIDEATQAVEPQALIPIAHGSRQVVLVGDHRQLGPVVLNKVAAKAGFVKSLFERLIELGQIPLRLQVQYRMHPCLSEFPSNMFYEGSLQNGVTVGERTKKNVDFPWPIPETPMFFLSSLGSEEMSSSGTSFLNRVEAINCEKIVSRFLKAAVLPSQIGVITPYAGQCSYIQQYMQTSGSLRKELYSEIEIASVDAFQGREKDYVIVSCVRSNDSQNIGFLSDPRRLNVALTRAKYGIIILGNPKVLSRNMLWSNLLYHFKEKDLLVEGQLSDLRPCLLQLSRPRTLKLSSFLQPSSKSSATAQHGFNFGFNPSSLISADTISQSTFDSISIASFSQQSQASFTSSKFGFLESDHDNSSEI